MLKEQSLREMDQKESLIITRAILHVYDTLHAPLMTCMIRPACNNRQTGACTGRAVHMRTSVSFIFYALILTLFATAYSLGIGFRHTKHTCANYCGLDYFSYPETYLLET